MSATFKVFSAVLSYPTTEFQDAAAELAQALAGEPRLAKSRKDAVTALIAAIAGMDILEAQAGYVDLFDRTRSLSLHLFEHVHGESRDRGQAMVSLLERYQQAGLDVAARELPDYIPLFLEFLSTRDAVTACADLKECAHILTALGERLRRRDSDYAAVFEALTDMAQAAPDRESLAQLRQEEMEDPHDLAALDRSWEEAEVRFGPGDAASDSCPRAHDILRRMDMPVATVPLSSQEAKT